MALKVKPKRLKWAKSRGAALVGLPLHYPMGVAGKYASEMDRLIRAMRKEYERELRELFEQLGGQLIGEDGAVAMDASLASQARILFGWLGRKYAKLFADRADSLTDRMISRVDRAAKASLEDSLRKASGYLTLTVPDMPGDLKDKLTAAAVENVALIKSIQAQYHERIVSAVMVSVQTGGKGAADVMKEIRHIGGLSEKRAHLIATDQTRKITSAMNAERAKSVGMRKFRWMHSGGSAEPRELHVKMNGQVFDYDDPPVIDDKTGERGFPGQLINCRCVAIPIIDFSDRRSIVGVPQGR